MFKNYISTKERMMYQGSILVLLQMVKKEATDIPVVEQGEAEWPYCALLDVEGMPNSSPTPSDGRLPIM